MGLAFCCLSPAARWRSTPRLSLPALRGFKRRLENVVHGLHEHELHGFLTSSGTSSRSYLLRFGSIDRLQAVAVGREHLFLDAADRAEPGRGA